MKPYDSVMDWEPRTKTISLITFIVGTTAIQTPLFAVISLMTAVIGSQYMKLSLTTLLKKWFLIAPFLMIMTLPLLWYGFMGDSTQLTLAAMLSLKALTSITIMIILLFTQPAEKFLAGLNDLKMPTILIQICFLTYRYIFLLLDDLKKMKKALASRSFNARWKLRAFKVYGELISTMLVKSIDRSDEIYKAMKARGYAGQLSFEQPRAIELHDIRKAVAFLVIIVTIIVVERLVM